MTHMAVGCFNRAVSFELGFQDHDGHALFGSMSDGKRDVANLQLIGDLRRNAMELQSRPPPPAPPAGADRLHGGFLGGESRGVAFVAVSLSLDVCDFGGGVYAIDK